MAVKGRINVRATMVAIPVLLLAELAGCVTTTHGNLASSASRLEGNADVLSRDSRDTRQDYASGYTRDASELAEETRDFRETLADRNSDDRDVKAAFERVSHTYHRLRDDVDRSDSHQAQVDLRPITEAYLDVEREMGGYDRRRYAREGDVPRDRY
jgi:outer membrane murein-binding lipoprotein Lpp